MAKREKIDLRSPKKENCPKTSTDEATGRGTTVPGGRIYKQLFKITRDHGYNQR